MVVTSELFVFPSHTIRPSDVVMPCNAFCDALRTGLLGEGSQGLVYEMKPDKRRCQVVWPNNHSVGYSYPELTVVGRAPEIKIGDLVERGRRVGEGRVELGWVGLGRVELGWVGLVFR